MSSGTGLLAAVSNKYSSVPLAVGRAGGVVVKTLRYKPAGRGFDSRCCNCNFSVT